jgi:hypothetical protein
MSESHVLGKIGLLWFVGAVAVGFLFLIAIPPLEVLIVVALGIFVACSSKTLHAFSVGPRTMSRNVWILSGLFLAAVVYLILAFSQH